MTFIENCGDFPDGPVIKTLGSATGDMGSILVRELRSCVLYGVPHPSPLPKKERKL